MKAMDFHSCQECNFDCCKNCRKKDISDNPICLMARHICDFKSDHSEGYYCDFCGDSNSEGMWNCDQDECQYDVCKSCIARQEVKCSCNHILNFELAEFDCRFCDGQQYPCMVCKGENCDFRICLECCVSDTKIKDHKGHPCRKDPEREQQKIVCDYCGKFKPGMVSCAICNIDICRQCSNEKKLCNNGLVNQPQINGEWHGVTVDERPYNYCDYKLDFKKNGEITGNGVDPNNGEDPQTVEIFGYSYLKNIAIIMTPQDGAPAYMFAGTADSEMDEIYGRWWLLDY